MKKLFGLISLLIISLSMAGCDIIQQEIERIESIELVDFAVDITDQSILLKITSDADEQVIEAVNINDTEYDLISQGDDWYLLEEVPIAKDYAISHVYYRSGFGGRLTFSINFEITMDEAIEEVPDDLLIEIDGETQFNAYTINLSETELAEISSENEFTKEVLADWAWLILEDDEPIFAIFEHNDILYLVEPPEEVDDYIEE